MSASVAIINDPKVKERLDFIKS